ncbi:MAG: phosphoglucosamine mutase [Methylacidiphilales bacterium]|nr:phosphoglucosamine mutase [Candidatus Methylacidiphilales bacterium]
MKVFGTDGIRGIIGEALLNPRFILNLGYAVGKVLYEQKRGPIIVGKDTRISGYMIESALEAGLSAAGVGIILTGPLPTPAIASLVTRHDAAGAFVISASHNTYEYNGLKIFNSSGEKLTQVNELEIESILETLETEPMYCVQSHKLGKAQRLTDAANHYIRYLISCVKHDLDLEKMKIVFDGANGAGYFVGPSLLRQLGAEVISINCGPDGLNINSNCGSTHPNQIKEMVLKTKADLGICLDGDGDRLVVVANNEIYNGDKILYLIAKSMKIRNLPIDGIVGTELSNGALPIALSKYGIEFTRSSVGDKHVYELLKSNNWQLGGEPSGHIIFREFANTGDGLLSALKVLEAIKFSNKTISELLEDYNSLPNLSTNITINSIDQVENILNSSQFKQFIQQLNSDTKNYQRVIVRKSGTENLLRVFVESESNSLNEKIVNDILEKIKL